MSPEDKRRLAFTTAALLAVALFFLVLSYIPTYLYLLFFFAGSCAVGYYKAEEFRLFDRLGLNPRRGLTVPPALLRCLPGGSLRGAPASVRNKSRANKGDARNSLAASVERQFGSSVQRREAFSDTAFSPRDLLMGSYLAKAESPHGAGRPVGSARLHIHPGEQLRERLVRPNNGVPTPSRRLSFGDPVGTTGRFTITPQRHYPLQQTGTSSVGVLPPAQWDGFRKKNILTQRNTRTHSPVTVKIARPDSASRSSFFDQIHSPDALASPGFGVQGDPCSRETVLNVLRESRKRDVDDEDKGHAAGQKSKRRRHDSSGSSQSAFEPLLANGAPSQLVPKPGSIKRGINASVFEESSMKRSRTSSISSVSGAPISLGLPGSVRNPIRSSFSSSQGYPQRRTASSLSLSPLTSPASSRCQTPERAAKKPREEDITSPSSASSMKSDKTAIDIVPGSGKCSPAPEATVTTSESGGSSGKRKRKIQLVSTRRGDQISMPPPPELGYTVTVKDLDMEKKAALSQIQKVLEDSEPEKPAPATAPSNSLFSQVAPIFSTAASPGVGAPSLAPLSVPAAGLPPASTTTVSVPAPTLTIDLTVAPASTDSPTLTLISATTISTPAAPAVSLANPLLESLKNMKNNSLLSTPSPLAATSTAPATSVMAKTPASVAPTGLGSGVLKSEPALVPPQSTVSTPLAPASQPTSSTPSAFAQILAQPLQPSSITFNVVGSSLFSLKPQAAPASAAPAAPTCTASNTPTIAASTATNPAPSGFKPIFGAATTAPASAAEVKPTQPIFKPIFGNATEGGLNAFGQPATSLPSAPASQNTASLFRSLSNTQPTAASVASPTPAAQTPSSSLFGNWPSVSAASASAVPAPAVNSTFQFGTQSSTTPSSGLGASTTTSSTSSSSSSTTTFQFSAVKPSQTAPTAAPQSTFMFGQTPGTQNSTTTTFGGFGIANNAATTTASAPTTQATFGSSTFSTSTSFPNTTTQAPAATKPFPFGAGSGTSGPAPFTFGAPASTAAPSFGTLSQPTFGSTTAASTFGTQSQPTFGGTTAAPTFGSQSQPSFGSTTAAPSFVTTTQPTFGNASAGTTVQPTFGNASAGTTAQPTFGNASAGTTAQPTFGNASAGFSFANTTTPSAAPAFGASTQTAAPTFTFGAAPATPQNNAQNAPAPAASGGFNFTASLSGAQFATPVPAAQTQGFSFGNSNADNKLAFGTSTPAFGNSSTPIPFGSPGTPVPGFNASPFNTPSAAFSIGACSKPSGSRQRLQARRQQRKK